MAINYIREKLYVKTVLILIVTCLFCACSSNNSSSSEPAKTDITNIIFTRTDVSCLAYSGNYSAQIKDIKNDKSFTSSATITVNDNNCTFSSNSIPNHDVNDESANLATPVA